MCDLPCLENLLLLGNPVTITLDYRTKTLAMFGDRVNEVEYSLPGYCFCIGINLILISRRDRLAHLFKEHLNSFSVNQCHMFTISYQLSAFVQSSELGSLVFY